MENSNVQKKPAKEVKKKQLRSSNAKTAKLLQGMDGEARHAGTAGELSEVSVASDDTVTKFPVVKRMITSLDKFLTRRILSVSAIYITAMLVCGFVLVSGGTVSNASSGQTGGSGPKSVDVWMYAIIATLSFMFLLCIIRIISVKKSKRKKS